MRNLVITVLVSAFVLVLLAGCSTPRVLVKNCQDAGPGLQNCEKVKDL